MDRPFVFLSYRSLDSKFALQLSSDCIKHGLPIWIDCKEIKTGDDRILTLQHAIAECAIFLPILSSKYLQSKYRRSELQAAIDLECPIYPILLETIEVEEWPWLLRSLQYIDFREWNDAAVYQRRFQQLVDELKTKISLRPIDKAPAWHDTPCNLPVVKLIEDKLERLKENMPTDLQTDFAKRKKALLNDRIELLTAQWDEAVRQVNTEARLNRALIPVINRMIARLENEIEETGYFIRERKLIQNETLESTKRLHMLAN